MYINLISTNIAEGKYMLDLMSNFTLFLLKL